MTSSRCGLNLTQDVTRLGALDLSGVLSERLGCLSTFHMPVWKQEPGLCLGQTGRESKSPGEKIIPEGSCLIKPNLDWSLQEVLTGVWTLSLPGPQAPAVAHRSDRASYGDPGLGWGIMTFSSQDFVAHFLSRGRVGQVADFSSGPIHVILMFCLDNGNLFSDPRKGILGARQVVKNGECSLCSLCLLRTRTGWQSGGEGGRMFLQSEPQWASLHEAEKFLKSVSSDFGEHSVRYRRGQECCLNPVISPLKMIGFFVQQINPVSLEFLGPRCASGLAASP